MIKTAGIGLIVLGIIHLVVLGAEVPAELSRWKSLNLWTFDHWAPLRSQAPDLALSNGVFWQSVGSFAVPMLILGSLIVWMDRKGIAVPSFVGWGLLAWTLLATLVMPPSGFPVALAVCGVLTAGIAARAKG